MIGETSLLHLIWLCIQCWRRIRNGREGKKTKQKQTFHLPALSVAAISRGRGLGRLTNNNECNNTSDDSQNHNSSNSNHNAMKRVRKKKKIEAKTYIAQIGKSSLSLLFVLRTREFCAPRIIPPVCNRREKTLGGKKERK